MEGGNDVVVSQGRKLGSLENYRATSANGRAKSSGTKDNGGIPPVRTDAVSDAQKASILACEK